MTTPSTEVQLARALDAARALALMVLEEFPGTSVARIVDTWRAPGITEAQVQAVAELEASGAL